MTESLFRKQVAGAESARPLGQVMLSYPVSYYSISLIALLIFFALICFGYFGKYTRHADVAGVIEPSAGVLKVFAPQGGVLRISKVQLGEAVKKGQVLFVFGADIADADGNDLVKNRSQKMATRLGALHEESENSVLLQNADLANMRTRLAGLIENSDILAAELRLQTLRVKSAAEMATRFRQLRNLGYLPEAQVSQKEDEEIAQQLALTNLRKTINVNNSEILSLRANIQTSGIRTKLAKAQLSQNISSVELAQSAEKHNQEWSIVAPSDGIVTSLLVPPSQRAEKGHLLANILPHGSAMQANLYVKSRSLGFLRLGQNVKLKMDSFPYQKFGLLHGRIVAIAETPTLPSELSFGNRLAANQTGNESVYLVQVALNKEYVTAYGQRRWLRPGMQLLARIELDTRFLYEWALEPLYTFR